MLLAGFTHSHPGLLKPEALQQGPLGFQALAAPVAVGCSNSGR